MSDKYKFFKNGIMLTAVGLAMRTVSMFFGAFVTRAVGAEGVGLFTLVMTVYSFAVTFATSGISLTVTRLVASAIGEGEEKRLGRILAGALLYSVIFGALACTFLYFGADFLGRHVLSDGRTADALRVLSFSLVPIALGTVFSGYFVGVKRIGFNASVQVLAQLVKISVTVFAVTRAAERGVREAVVALCAAVTLTEVVAFLVIFLEFLYDRRKNAVSSELYGADVSPVAKMALPLALSAYVRSFLLNFEHILIPKKLRERGESDAEAYSHYGVLHGMALPLIMYPMSPLSSFSGLLVPEFAEDLSAGRKTRMNSLASRALNTTLSYAAICAVFLFSFAEELGYVIYDSYDAGYYVSTLALVVPIMYLDHVTDSMLKGIGEHVFSMWVNISDSLLSVLLVWMLIPRLGIIGYAIVIVVMESYNFLLSFVRLRHRVTFRMNIIRAFLLPLVLAFISTFISDITFRFGGSTATPIWLIAKIVFAASITVASLALGNLVICKKEQKSVKTFDNKNYAHSQ